LLASIVIVSLAMTPVTAGARTGEHRLVATFSIVAVDTANGEVGVAVASRFLAVGSVVPWVRADVGAVATQSLAKTTFGTEGLALLEDGLTPQDALNRLLSADDRADTRQIGIVNARGESATFTGERCHEWAGGVRGPGYAIQGNRLLYEDVLYAMQRAFTASRGTLSERLLETLRAAETAGGDRLGKQAAALIVERKGGGYGGGNDRYVDLRVDDSETPIADLARLYDQHAKTFLPAVHIRLGQEARARGDRERAEIEYTRVVYLYREAIRKDPRDPEPKNALAWFFARRRTNLDEALILAREARGKNSSWEVLDTLAEIHWARGEFRAAQNFAKQALEVEPENIYLQNRFARFTEAAEKEDLR
jgi:uncharacterized Ntn-hydrolase superfamily protein